MKHDSRVSGRITQWEQFGVRGLKVASRRASSRTELFESAVQPANLILGEAGAPGQGGQLLREIVQRLLVVLWEAICGKVIKLYCRDKVANYGNVLMRQSADSLLFSLSFGWRCGFINFKLYLREFYKSSVTYIYTECIFTPLRKISKDISVPLQLDLETQKYTKSLQKDFYI